MKEELISVIIGSYNNADVIRETIDSFITQTYRNLEIILVDDGSTDDTLKIMNEYKQKDSRVKVFHHDNSGASATRELGYINSTGDYIFLSDADDTWDPNTLNYIYQLMIRKKSIDAVFTSYREEYDYDIISTYKWEEHENENTLGKPTILTGRELAINFYKNNGIRIGGFVGVLFKRGFFDKLYKKMLSVKDIIPTHYFNDSYCEAQICGLLGECILTNKVHMLQRISSTSLSHKQNVSSHVKNYPYAAEYGISLYKELGWEEVYKFHLLRFYLVMLKSWFRVYLYETDYVEKQQYTENILKMYNKYFDEIKHYRCNDFEEFAYYICIRMWKYSKKLWVKIVKIICGW